MGFSSEQGKVCKKHPAHVDKQGVCPSCLRDRLFHLNHPSGGSAAGVGVSVSSVDKAASVHSSAAASSSSASASSSHDDYHDTFNSADNKPAKDSAAEEEGEAEQRRRVGRAHHRNASSSEIGSMSFRGASGVVSSGAGNAGLKKCRSVAASYSFAPQPPKAMSRRVDGGGGGEKMFFSDYEGYGNNRSGGGGGGGGGNNNYGYGAGKKKKGFWTKLLHLKGKNKEVLIHQQQRHQPAMAMEGRAY